MMLAYQRLVGQVALVLSTIIIVVTLPVLDLITINLAVITTTLAHRLYWEIRLTSPPVPKDYAVSTIKLVFWVSIFYTAWLLAGQAGLWGIIILSVVIAAYKIYQGWTLFDTSTKWMADKIWNRTTNDYNLLEALTNEQGNSTTTIREDTHGTPGQNEDVKEEPSGSTGQQQHTPTNTKDVQEVSHDTPKVRKPRTRTRQNKVLPELPKDLGTRNEVKQQ